MRGLCAFYMPTLSLYVYTYHVFEWRQIIFSTTFGYSVMRRMTTFRSTTDRTYDGSSIRL